MQKFLVVIASVLLLTSCDKHDPILPGQRTAIFASETPTFLNTDIQNLPENLPNHDITVCPYTQGTDNVIRDGDRKIFTGFPTPNAVASTQKPICSGNFVYAGLTTGELVKVNARTREIIWIADIYSPSNMTGGASVVDITAPLVLNGKHIYVGGHGDAFCRINTSTGAKDWCDKISVSVPFIVTDNVSFVLGTDYYLYAIRNQDGAVYWRTFVKSLSTPVYNEKTITVGKTKINAINGKII